MSPLIGFMTARRLPHLNFLRLHKRKGSRSRGNLASRSAPVLAMVIHFVFCRFIKEVLARSLPQRPDSQATDLHSITSQKQPTFHEDRAAEAIRTIVGPQFWIMVCRFLRSL